MPFLRVEAVAGIHPYGSVEDLHALLQAGARPYSERGVCECPPAAFVKVKAIGTSMRRTPRLARLALACLLELPHFHTGTAVDGERCALVVSTAFASVRSTFDFMDSLLADGPDMASPTAFSHSVTNMTAAMLGQHLRLTGPALTVTDAEGGSFRPALLAAAGMLMSGAVDRVFLCSAEERHAPMDAVVACSGASPSSLEGAVAFVLSLPTGEPCPHILVPAFGETHTTEVRRIPPATDVYGPGALAQAWNCALAALSMRKGLSGSARCVGSPDAGENGDVMVIAGAEA